MENSINKTIEDVNKAFAWEKNVEEKKMDPFTYRRKLIDFQRELEDMKFAVAEKCSVAAFGESQMGKSYMISALLSEPGVPFMVSDELDRYDFKDEINPSLPNSSLEATGVVTRFSTADRDPNIPEHYLKVRMLSVADLVLVLAEAYYVQVNRISRDPVVTIHRIAERVKECPIQNNVNSILTEADVAYIEEYLKTSSMGVNCSYLFSEEAGLFRFLIKNVRKISNNDIVSLLSLIWNENASFNKLFKDLLRVHQELNYQLVNYVEFKSVLRKNGTLLDVARLDEMYSPPESVGKDYVADALVKLSLTGNPKTLKKAFLSALVAELTFNVKPSNVEDKQFLDCLDLLDFPGLRPDQKRDEEKLEIGKNLTTVFRRGKVTYLFNKYSKTKRISSLLFCHNHNQSNQCTMGPVLQDWVKKNVGVLPADRESFVNSLGTSPLFVISTWFNMDLMYADETVDADLNERWNRRFKSVLSKEVLQSADDPDHWFNNWTTSQSRFNNMFVLRDFRFSKMIFSGYDPTNNGKEQETIDIPTYPQFLKDLRESFVGNDFVCAHFVNPIESWDNAATPQNDGTKLIIRELNRLAPNAEKARKEKFEKDLSAIRKNLYDLLYSLYHPENPLEQIKKAKKEAADIVFTIDSLIGRDPYFFGKLIDAMMISNSMVYQKVFSLINGKELDPTLSSIESEIFMGAGMDPNETRNENVRRLCEYLGADTYEECAEKLAKQEVDIEVLLGKVQMVQSKAEQLVYRIEQLWRSEFLNAQVASQFKDSFPLFEVMLEKLFILYDRDLDVHSILTRHVQKLMDMLAEPKQPGIIADYLRMSFNKFVSTCGFSYMDDELMSKLQRMNEDLNLGIDTDLIKDDTPTDGIEFLSKIDDLKKKQTVRYSKDAREIQKQLPQYRNRWRWQHRLRAAFALQHDYKDYNVVANDELKKIIDSIYQ